MHLKPLALALLVTLSVAGAVTWAQQPGAPAAETSAPVKATVEEPNTATPAARAPEQPIADDNGSPYDYQSSEEISEDLSVSFPVDI
jgi:hypothetical protein